MDECQTAYALLENFRKKTEELELENKNLRKDFRTTIKKLKRKNAKLQQDFNYVVHECDYYKRKLLVNGFKVDY